MSTTRPEVLFLCVHNAGRSQMAAALLAAGAGDRIVVHSAGSAPGETLNPAVVDGHGRARPRHLGREAQEADRRHGARRADVIVTMGCGDECPVYPGKRYWTGNCPTPPAKTLDEVRSIRDEIALRVERLIVEILGDPDGAAASTS